MKKEKKKKQNPNCNYADAFPTKQAWLQFFKINSVALRDQKSYLNTKSSKTENWKLKEMIGGEELGILSIWLL